MNLSSTSRAARSLNNLNLKSIRERSGLRLKDVAKYIGCSESKISRWEADPSALSNDDILNYLEAIGFVDIVTPPLQLENPYSQFHPILKILIDRIARLPVAPKGSAMNGVAAIPAKESLLASVRLAFRIPVVCAMGTRDVGKSTFINSLIGEAILPAARNPITRIPTLLRHSSRKPACEPVYDVAVFPKKHIDLAMNGADIRPLMVGSIDLVDRFIHSDISGAADEPIIKEAGLIMVYKSCDVLHACDVLDLPGLGESQEDTETAEYFLGTHNGEPRVDGLFLLTSAMKVFDPAEFVLLRNWIATRELSTLQIVVTRSKSVNEKNYARVPLMRLAKILHPKEDESVIDDVVENYMERVISFYQPTPSEHEDGTNPKIEKMFSSAQSALCDFLGTQLSGHIKARCLSRLEHIKEGILAELDGNEGFFKAFVDNPASNQDILDTFRSKTYPVAKETIARVRSELPTLLRNAQHQVQSEVSTYFGMVENSNTLEKRIRDCYLDEEKKAAYEQFPLLLKGDIERDLREIILNTLNRLEETLSQKLDGADALKEAIKLQVDLAANNERDTLAIAFAALGAFTFTGGGSAAVAFASATGGLIGLTTGSATTAAWLSTALADITGISLGIALVALGWKLLRSIFTAWQKQLAEEMAKELRRSSATARAQKQIQLLFLEIEKKTLTRLEEIDKANDANLTTLETATQNASFAGQLMERLRAFRAEFIALPWPTDEI